MKVSGFTFVTLFIAVSLSAQNRTVEYLPGSTVKITKLIGDYDRQQDRGGERRGERNGLNWIT